MNDDSGYELVERWKDLNKAWCFEGNPKNLTKLVSILGYRESCFGSAIDDFLTDNPGAQSAIVEWISEWIDRNPEWREAMLAEVTCPECEGSQPPGEVCPECGEEGDEQ